jgi:hypothetical protein
VSDGLLYEPRSFWSIGTFGSTEGQTDPSIIQLNRQHFYNGERWPVQINRITTAGINYTFVNPPVGLPANYQAGSVTTNAVRVRITAPQRYHYGPKRSFELAAMGPLATWTPAPGLSSVVIEGDPITFNPSSLWGQCALKFDNPLYIPRTSALEWDISSYTPWASGGKTPVPQPAATIPTCHQLYEEPGGLFAGDARTRSFKMRAFNGTTPLQDERWPFMRGRFQPFVAGQPNETADWWHPDGRFNVRQFDLQEATRAGSTSISGMRTFIDQIAYDAFMVEEGLAPAANRACPLSMRVGTRVRLANAGSNTWWWRPGAPLCLVFDSITPANVYQLHEPITIGPGDTLDVQMEFPPASPGGLFTDRLQFGISFNGFAAIEG